MSAKCACIVSVTNKQGPKLWGGPSCLSTDLGVFHDCEGTFLNTSRSCGEDLAPCLYGAQLSVTKPVTTKSRGEVNTTSRAQDKLGLGRVPLDKFYL